MSTERKNPYKRDQALNDATQGQTQEKIEKTLNDSDLQKKKDRRSNDLRQSDESQTSPGGR